MPNKHFVAQQMNRAFQIFAQGLNLDEEHAMEIADLYPPWEVGEKYLVGTILKYGLNQYGETQLYSVIQEHISQEDWKPDSLPALYKAIGFKDDIPIWVQPLGYEDAWEIGDVVWHNDILWICEEGNATGAHGLRNTFEPGVWGWAKKAD